MIASNKNIIIISVLLYISQFIVSDIYYGDDLFRAVDGYFLWGDDGRPLADIFYHLILQYRTSILPDIFPIPLLISAIIFAIVFSKIIERFNLGNGFFQSLIPVIFLSNTFFISNILFRYDGSFMLLAVVSSCIPFAMSRSNKATWSLVTVISIVSSFCLYQSSVNVYIGLAAIYSYVIYRDQRCLKSVLQYISLSIILLALAYVIYSIILKFIPLNNHFSQFNKPIELSSDGLSTLIANFKGCISIVSNLFSSGMLYPVLFMYSLSFISVIKSSITERNPLIIILYLTSVLVCSFSIIGIVAFGQYASLFFRVFCGFSVFTILPLVVLYKEGFNRVLSAMACLFVLISQLVICSATLNASKAEVTHADNLSSEIISDMNKYGVGDTISIIGSPAHAARTIPILTAFPIVSDLIPVIFRDGYDGGRYTLIANGMKKINFVSDQESAKIKEAIANSTPLNKNESYSYFIINNSSVIYFK